MDKVKDRVAARVTLRCIHLREFQELAPIGKRVEDMAIDIFRVSGGKIVEHWRDGYHPTDFLPQPGVPDLSENANLPTFNLLHRIAVLSHIRRIGRVLGGGQRTGGSR